MKHTTHSRNRRLSARESQLGPAPNNFLKELRESLSYTVQGAADEMGISKQALIRLEQGTFEHILPRALNWYLIKFGVSELTLTDSYEEFQNKTRQRSGRLLGDLNVPLDTPEHPLRYLRRLHDINPTELAKALCIPQATIVYFERKPKLQKSVPKCLVNALLQCGYRNYEVDNFKASYTIYRGRFK